MVSNKINNQSITTSFNVLHQVGGLSVNMLKPSVGKDDVGSVVVELLKGTNVTINVLFGDYERHAEPLFAPEAYRKHQWNYRSVPMNIYI